MPTLLQLIYKMPLWLTCSTLILLYSAVASGLFYLLARRIHLKFRISDDTNNVISGVLATIGVLYGLLLGLVSVDNWDNFDDARNLSATEAAAISAFYRDVAILHHPRGPALQGDVRNYLRKIIRDEFPAYNNGVVPEGSYHLLDAIHRDLVSYSPEGPVELQFYKEAVSHFNRMVELRDLRIDSVAHDGLPVVFWYAIVMGSLAIIVVSFFFHMPSYSGHLFLVNCITFFTAVMVFLIVAVDNPWRGTISVSPGPYAEVLSRSLPSLALPETPPEQPSQGMGPLAP
jgi:hypothetical protein